MDPQRWTRIQQVFHDALAEPDQAMRRTFVEAAAGGDRELCEEVLGLLAEDASRTTAAALRSGGAARLAGELIGPDAGQPPVRIGPYRIVSEAGRGGMGVVYLAERDDLGSRAAIKILPNAWLSAGRRARFEMEARTLAQLTHPSIARLYDAGVLDSDGTPWFAMEWVDGEPITAYAERQQLDVRKRLALFRQVCGAVVYAHGQAILHRDLKPSNIFVKADGGVRLLDFGIAKRLDGGDETAGQARTHTGLALMTPAYAAPEVVRGAPATVRADVYSLGVVLHELLGGAPAFALQDKTPGEALAIVAAAAPAAPSSLRTRARGASKPEWVDLNVVVRTAMHPDPSRRYSSVEALDRDVERFLNGAALEARPDETLYRIYKFAGRNRRALATAGLTLTAMLALAGFFMWRLAAARDEALAEAARAQRIQRFMLDLFEGGDKQAGPREDLRVLTLVDRSARDVERLEGDPETQTDLLQTLGGVYHGLGQYERSSALLTRALARRRALSGSLTVAARQVESLESLGLLRVDQGQFTDAERLIREALALAQSTLPVRHPAVASATAALGRVQLEQGKYPEAIATLERALQVPSGDADRASRLLRLANAFFYSGSYGRAEEISGEVLRINTRLYGKTHPAVADALINLGAVAQQRGRFGDARGWYARALEIHRAHYGPQHPEAAASLMGIARALTFEKRYSEAEPLLAEVLVIRERVYGPVHPNVASTLSSLGHVALGQGRYKQAEARYQRMADIYRKTNGPNHHFVALALSNLASVYTGTRDYARAEATLRAAMRIYETALPADHLDTAVARSKLGRVMALLGRKREAGKAFEQALRVLEAKAPQSPQVAAIRTDLEELTRPAAWRPPDAR